jgi:hypothetical protein
MKPRAGDYISLGVGSGAAYWLERGETRERLSHLVFKALLDAGRLKLLDDDTSTVIGKEWLILPPKEKETP